MASKDLDKWITSDIDFYEFLGLEFEAFSESELRRAYRKTALKYHPDKVGKNFDPEKYELFQAAYEILSSPGPKSQYDQYRHAKIQRKRANELFEGKRRKMKEDLESREKNGILNELKRSRNNEASVQMDPELRRLAEEGRKRRAARASMMAESTTSSPVSVPSKDNIKLAKEQAGISREENEDEKIEQLERRIREAEQIKAKRKAEKKARKNGILTSDSDHLKHQDCATPIKSSGIPKELNIDENSASSPKFSFSPSIATSQKNDFSETMARLRAAEKRPEFRSN